jgi:hypothetical protein
MLSGFGAGAAALLAGIMMGREDLAHAPPGSNALNYALMLIFPALLVSTGVLLLAVGAVHGARLWRRPRAFLMDRDGVEGFLLFGRRRIAWRDISEVTYKGAWIHLRSGRQTLYINPSQLHAIDGHDPAALIDYFLRGVLRRM